MTARPDDLPAPPAAAALITATLALMTGWAALQSGDHDDTPTPGAPGDPDHRPCIARKIGQNLGLLADHPGLPEGMRLVMGNLQQRWGSLLRTRCAALSAAPTPLAKPPGSAADGATGPVRAGSGPQCPPGPDAVSADVTSPAVRAAAEVTGHLLARLRARG